MHDDLKEQLAEASNLNFGKDETRMTITEVSKLLNIPAQTIRNWDREGKLKSERDDKDRRWYKRCDVDAFRAKQMSGQEFYIANVTPKKVRAFIESLLAVFDTDQPINISIRNDRCNQQAEFTVDSADYLSQVKKTMKWMV